MFENANRNNSAVIQRICGAIKEFSMVSYTQFPDTFINPIYFDNKPIGFFDGVVNNDDSGVGLVLKIYKRLHVEATLNIRLGSNIRAELIGLWSLLHLVSSFHLADLMIVGDSKVILDWFEGRNNLHGLTL